MYELGCERSSFQGENSTADCCADCINVRVQSKTILTLLSIVRIVLYWFILLSCIRIGLLDIPK